MKTESVTYAARSCLYHKSFRKPKNGARQRIIKKNETDFRKRKISCRQDVTATAAVTHWTVTALQQHRKKHIIQTIELSVTFVHTYFCALCAQIYKYYYLQTWLFHFVSFWLLVVAAASFFSTAFETYRIIVYFIVGRWCSRDRACCC